MERDQAYFAWRPAVPRTKANPDLSARGNNAATMEFAIF